MRPDTEPNPHAKRIMAGAAALTVAALGVRGATWVSVNYPFAGRAAMVLVCATVACYTVGTVVMAMTPGNDERGRP